MPNCSEATCQGNGVITVSPRHCPKVQKPTCANGYPAVQVADHDSCCSHYQCPCECAGWGGAGRGAGAEAERAERNQAGPREDTPRSRHQRWRSASTKVPPGALPGPGVPGPRRDEEAEGVWSTSGACCIESCAVPVRGPQRQGSHPAPLGVGLRVPGAGGSGAALQALAPLCRRVQWLGGPTLHHIRRNLLHVPGQLHVRASAADCASVRPLPRAGRELFLRREGWAVLPTVHHR